MQSQGQICGDFIKIAFVEHTIKLLHLHMFGNWAMSNQSMSLHCQNIHWDWAVLVAVLPAATRSHSLAMHMHTHIHINTHHSRLIKVLWLLLHIMKADTHADILTCTEVHTNHSFLNTANLNWVSELTAPVERYDGESRGKQASLSST